LPHNLRLNTLYGNGKFHVDYIYTRNRFQCIFLFHRTHSVIRSFDGDLTQSGKSLCSGTTVWKSETIIRHVGHLCRCLTLFKRSSSLKVTHYVPSNLTCPYWFVIINIIFFFAFSLVQTHISILSFTTFFHYYPIDMKTITAKWLYQLSQKSVYVSIFFEFNIILM